MLYDTLPAKSLKKSKAEIMRQAIEKGIHVMTQQNTSSSQIMTKISVVAKNTA